MVEPLEILGEKKDWNRGRYLHVHPGNKNGDQMSLKLEGVVRRSPRTCSSTTGKIKSGLSEKLQNFTQMQICGAFPEETPSDQV